MFTPTAMIWTIIYSSTVCKTILLPLVTVFLQCNGAWQGRTRLKLVSICLDRKKKEKRTWVKIQYFARFYRQKKDGKKKQNQDLNSGQLTPILCSVQQNACLSLSATWLPHRCECTEGLVEKGYHHGKDIMVKVGNSNNKEKICMSETWGRGHLPSKKT